MLLAIDIGNSAIKFGVFDGEVLLSKFSIPNKRNYTADDLVQATASSVDYHFESAIACSVVPQVDQAVFEFVIRQFGLEILFLDNAFDFGLTVKYESVSTLGTDRLVNAFAAAAKYGTPLIVCSLGTATTIDVVNAENEYLGGVIAPGISAMAEALHLLAAKLPRAELKRPEKVIGTSTITSLESGIFYGYASLVDGLVGRVSAEIDLTSPPKVIATGGVAPLMFSVCESIDINDEDLLLDGLRRIFDQTPREA